MNYKNLSAKNICVSIANKSFEECLLICKNAELVELRLDLLNLDFNHLEQLFKLDTQYIITHRLGELLNEQATAFLMNIIDLGAKYIDIELEENNKYITELIEYAQNADCKIILSYHNFEHTPNMEELQKIIDSAKNKNADYVKIATQVKSQTEVARILSLYEKNDKIIAFGMGEVGRISRVTSLYLGANFTYVAPDKNSSTASGQLTFDEMSNIFKLI